MNAFPQVEAGKLEPGCHGVSIDARRHPLVAQFERCLRDLCGVPQGATIILGVSGGADSMAMLIAAAVLTRRETSPINAVTVHVDHQLRSDSGDDAAHVEAASRNLGVPCRTVRVDVPTEGGNVYEHARRLRYDALACEAAAAGTDFIAVAHQADDQFETVLMNLCRGCDIGALAGMPWSRLIDAHANRATVIRPLLEATHDDCVSLCEAAGVQWREDPANSDRLRRRARLRRDVVPVLVELWPNATRRATGLGEALSHAAQCVDSCVEDVFGAATVTGWERDALAAHPFELIAAGLRRAAIAMEPALADQLSRAHVLDAARTIRSADRSPKSFDWPIGVTIEIRASTVRLTRNG